MDMKDTWNKVTTALSRFAEYSNIGETGREDSEK